MARNLSRRTFLKTLAATGAAVTLLPHLGPLIRSARAAEANAKLNVASIGVGGMGWNDFNTVGGSPVVNVVAVCDVNQANADKAAAKFPGAKAYTDFRKLFDELAKKFDAVTVSTPDHMHAPIAMTALNAGKHVYCQKPLTHEIYEARQLMKIARQKGLVTQMGIQIHSNIEYRMAVQMLQSGAIGKVKEVHSWSDRPGWPQGGTAPTAEEPAPAGLNWDGWLGVTAARPYHKAYQPFAWRGFLDFGCGALGDMGCHIIDPPFTALQLGSPVRVWADGPGATKDMHAKWEIIHYEFPGTQYTADKTLVLHWYDGGKQPDAALAPLPAGEKLPGNGSIFLGEKGVMLLPHVGGPRLLPKEQFTGYQRPQLKPQDHYLQWVAACRGEDKASANFDFAGPLTEAVLLGVLSTRFIGQKLEWDGPNMKVANVAEANAFLRRTYRKGWEVENL